jgi:hypothetical protein
VGLQVAAEDACLTPAGGRSRLLADLPLQIASRSSETSSSPATAAAAAALAGLGDLVRHSTKGSVFQMRLFFLRVKKKLPGKLYFKCALKIWQIVFERKLLR